jgi:hypothetical protein
MQVTPSGRVQLEPQNHSSPAPSRSADAIADERRAISVIGPAGDLRFLERNCMSMSALIS